jgi:hypothetical protein
MFLHKTDDVAILWCLLWTPLFGMRDTDATLEARCVSWVMSSCNTHNPHLNLPCMPCPVKPRDLRTMAYASENVLCIKKLQVVICHKSISQEYIHVQRILTILFARRHVITADTQDYSQIGLVKISGYSACFKWINWFCPYRHLCPPPGFCSWAHFLLCAFIFPHHLRPSAFTHSRYMVLYVQLF